MERRLQRMGGGSSPESSELVPVDSAASVEVDLSKQLANFDRQRLCSVSIGKQSVLHELDRDSILNR